MEDQKTREQLLSELEALQRRVAELESLAAEYRQVQEALRQRMVAPQTDPESTLTQVLAADLRGPLGLIVSFAQVLEEDYATVSEEELRRFLAAIAQRGRKMIEVVDRLLAARAGTSRMDRGQMGVLDMAAIVDEALDRLAYAIGDSQAQVVLPANWPAAHGHGPWVEEVWANLLSNAIKYGGQPPRIELGATAPHDGIVRFWVRDNGPGISLEERMRLFTQPEQAQATEYGLGLALVQRIVKRLGGQVGVESEAGRGSTFYFTLPAVE